MAAEYSDLAFFELFQDQLEASGGNTTDEHVVRFWHDVLVGYFRPRDAYTIRLERGTKGPRDVRLLVVYLIVLDEPDGPTLRPRLMLHLSGPTPAHEEAWRSARGLFDHASGIARRHRVRGLWYGAAQGRLVKFYQLFDGKGRQLTSSKPHHPKSPIDVVEDQRCVHEMLAAIQELSSLSVPTL